MPKSTYADNALLNAIFNASAFPSIAKPWISLHSADPGLTGASELSGGNYGRVDGSGKFSTATVRVVSNTSAVVFPTATAAWTQATHFGVFDAQTVGNFLLGGKIGTWSADLATWLAAYLLYLVGSGADPGAAPTFTAAPRTVQGAGDVLQFAIGALTSSEL